MLSPLLKEERYSLYKVRICQQFNADLMHTLSTSSSYPILVPFPIFRENFIKNIKKPPTADALYLEEGVGNE
jgi:hypothetical protein